MKYISPVILLCCSAWMAIYLYGEYALSSVKYHSSLVIFPVALFILAFMLVFVSTEGKQDE